MHAVGFCPSNDIGLHVDTYIIIIIIMWLDQWTLPFPRATSTPTARVLASQAEAIVRTGKAKRRPQNLLLF